MLYVFITIQVDAKVVWHSAFYMMPIESSDFCATLCIAHSSESHLNIYKGADKSLARPTSRCILFDGQNISFDASLVICI